MGPAQLHRDRRGIDYRALPTSQDRVHIFADQAKTTGVR
jgi:hypothetical protein